VNALVQYYADRVSEVVAQTTAMANFETPTGSKEHVDRLGHWIETHVTAMGAQVQCFPRDTVGDILLAKWNPQLPGKPILFLMHMDTVWPVGTLASRPVHVEGDRLIGPGAWDMKGSIACVLAAIRGLRNRGEFPSRPVWALFTSDEETGSMNSWELIEETARQAGLCLVMEFAATNSGLKTWRKGIANYAVKVTGKSSHAGNAPEKGINAVVELAHQTLKMTDLNALDRGTSVSVTVFNGGGASNVIPAEATAKVDVRFKSKAEADRIDVALHALQPVLAGAGLDITRITSRPPMERDTTMERSYAQARSIAARLGFDLPEEGSGGGSDGNITAALGLPTLDGLGPMGEGAHAVHEQVVISSIPARVALLDRIIVEWDFGA
jgi:glutamate carboxypeptidase